MAEPEEVLIDATRRFVVALGRIRSKPPADTLSETNLLAHRARLTLLLTAVYDVELTVRVSFPPARPSFLRRLFGRPRVLSSPLATPATDGRSVFLPQNAPDGWPLTPAEWFRVLALLQGERATRSVLSHVPPMPDLNRDLFLMSEARAAETALRRNFPGTTTALDALRSFVLARRPSTKVLRPIEQAVESLYLAHVAGRNDLPPAASSVDDSVNWARSKAEELGRLAGSYRGLKPDAWLGDLLPTPIVPTTRRDAEIQPSRGPVRTGRLARRPKVRQGDENEDDTEPGMLMLQMDDPHEHVEDPMGMQRPADRDAGQNPEQTADSLSELPEARLVATPDRAKEVFTSDDSPNTGAQFDVEKREVGLLYPEWDFRSSSYRTNAVTVRLESAGLGDLSWAKTLITHRRALFEDVKRRFEGLKPRRKALKRQWSGDEPDLDACVEAMIERRAGRTPDERLYIDFRPARRDMAILLLVDVSGSTDAWVSGRSRVIDVEKEALLLCTHALTALGDPFGIQAFSGEGPRGVRVWSIKEFEDRDTERIHRRISALEPETHTRLGAAIRHAITTLVPRMELHRLLLVLSDGRPHDVDAYSGRYGVEDARQAVNEAKTEGIHSFCLTVDREAPAYVGHIFGPGGAATLAQPNELSRALLEVLRQVARQ